MSKTVQEFVAGATLQAAEDLLAAYHNLPEERQGWSPGGESRSALDLVSECALLAGYTAEVLQTRALPPGTLEGYPAAHAAAMALEAPALDARLREAAQRMAEAVRSVPDGDLGVTVELPWGAWTLERLIPMAYWNMTYHLGQINYIARLP